MGGTVKAEPRSRAERALATRRRMVRAAYDTFSSEGYLGTTITAVAKRAGVATPTVYYTFGSKTALLGETLGAAILGFERWREPPREPFVMTDLLPVHAWWAEFVAAPTAREALDVFVRHGTDVLRRVGPLVPALQGAAGEPDGLGLLRVSEERRVETYREVVRVVAPKPDGLREGLGQDLATDIVLVLFSAEAYQGLVARRWSHEQSTTFFAQLLAGQVLAPGR